MSGEDSGESREFRQEHFYEEGVAGGMLRAEVEEFLASEGSVWLLKLATLKEDGWPMIVPLWYQWSGGSFWVVGRKRSTWVEDLKREPRCSICIEEIAHPSSSSALQKWWRGLRWQRTRLGFRWLRRWRVDMQGLMALNNSCRPMGGSAIW